MSTLKGAFALLMITGLLLVLSVNLFAPGASGRADFYTWANRSIRVPEPVSYNTTGTATCAMCSWKGVQGVGNLGIGNGNVKLVYPMFINDAMRSFNKSLNAGLNSSNVIAGNETTASAVSETGNGARISGGIDTGTCPTCELAAEQAAGLVEPLTPSYALAGGVIARGTTYGITLGRPFPHILNENPVEMGVLYAKMYGLPMPNGDIIDIGIKSWGYEY